MRTQNKNHHHIENENENKNKTKTKTKQDQNKNKNKKKFVRIQGKGIKHANILKYFLYHLQNECQLRNVISAKKKLW